MTRGSIFAKLSGLSRTGYLRNPNWSSVAVYKEQAGLYVQRIAVKVVIGYFGYELGTRMFSKAPKIARYELWLQEAKDTIKLQERALSVMAKGEEDLAREKEEFMKRMTEYNSRASK